MNTEQAKNLVIEALEDMKANDIVVLDVSKTSTFTDLMIICSGGSNRQVKAIAGEVVIRTKAADFAPLGVEGENAAEWVLVDLGDVVVHVMQQQTREFYQLEKLWDPELADRPAASEDE